jgi:RNA polymerase sporulation-specific sigma factor
MLHLLSIIIQNIFFLTGSYSNTVFKDVLSKDEESYLIDQMLNNNKDARNKLIEHNLRLVAHIVKKYESINYDSDDLIGIGTIGLIKGIDSYTKEKETRITTYVARCIENAMFTLRTTLLHFKSFLIYYKIKYPQNLQFI